MDRKLGHYRILAPLGSGGMGDVFLAEDERLGRKVALKVIGAAQASSPIARKRLQREARTAAAIDHPGVCTIYDVSEAGGESFIAMQYVEGESLAARLRRSSMSHTEIRTVARQVVEALAAAHGKGVLHRDIKPQNIMLTPSGRVVVLDFGLASLKQSDDDPSRLTNTGQIVGTPSYMSPEQISGHDLDHRSDIFSLGVLLYELLTALQPFSRPSVAATITAVLFDHPPLDAVPPEWQPLLKRALAKDRGARYRNMEELLVDLEALGSVTPSPEASDAKTAVMDSPLVAPVNPADAGEVGAAVEAPTSGARPRGSAFRFLQWARPAALLAILLFALPGGLFIANVGGLRDRLWGPALDARTLLILPGEVRGQVEGADYAGRAFAEAVAMNLTQAEDLIILPVPEPGELGEEGALGQVQAARNLRAGLLLTASVSREKEAVRARLSLVDTAENRLVWGAEDESADGDLSRLALVLSRGLLDHFGVTGSTGRRMYDSHHYELPNPAVAAAPEFAEARIGLRNNVAPVRATGSLVRQFPDDALVRVMHADALLQAASSAPPDSPRHKAFEESLAEVHRVDPHNPWDDMLRALYDSEHHGKRREEIETYSRLLDRDDLKPGGRALILTLRGQSKADLESIEGGLDVDIEGGIADVEEALRLTPANDFSHIILGSMLELAERHEEALLRVRHATALNPSSILNQASLGDLTMRLGKWEEALPALEKSCEGGAKQDGGDQFYCVNWAIGLWRTGRQDEARHVAQRAASMPETLSGLVSLACYHAQAGERAEALGFLDRLLELKPTALGTEGWGPCRNDSAFETLLAEARRRADR